MAISKKSKTSHTQENYLKALYHLMLEKEQVTINDIASRLNIKMPSATSMMQKMADEKLIRYEKYKPIRLTDLGKREAALVIRKHRLTEMFLVEKMGFGWEEVHDIAEQIEHIRAPKFFKKMDEMLGFPAKDPHGSPIPDSEGNYQSLSFRTLNEARPGDKVKIAGLTNSDTALLQFLNSKGIGLGTKMKVMEKESFDHSMKVMVGKRDIMLSHIVTQQLLFEQD